MSKAASVLILKYGQLLRVSKDNQKWSEPGGKIEGNETPWECAVRECKEEAGIDCSEFPLIKTFVVEACGMTCFVLDGTVCANPVPANEIKHVEWCNLSDAILGASFRLQQSLKAAQLLRPTSRAKRPLSPVTVVEKMDSKRQKQDPDEFTLVEQPDMAVMEWLVEHPDVPSDHRAGMKRYFELALRGAGSVSITYRRQPSGRFGVDEMRFGKCSLPMKRVARAAAFGHLLVDVDLVNCHPSLLLQTAEECSSIAPENYELLSYYIENRDRVFKEEGWAKGVAKRFLNVTLFGGSIATFLEEEAKEEDGWDGLEQDIPEFWRRLRAELKNLGKLVWRRAVPDSQQDAIEEWTGSEEWKRRHPGKTRHVGTYIANVLQSRETDIIVPAIKELQAMGVVVSSYQYDGFQCPKEHLEVLEAWVAGRNGRPGRARYAIKPFGHALEKVPEPPFECYNSRLFAWNPNEFLVTPERNEEGEITPEAREEAEQEMEHLVEQKAKELLELFENYAIKCHSPPGILWLPEGIETVDKTVRSFTKCKSGLFDNLKIPVFTGVMDGKPDIESKPLVNTWLAQGDLKEYTAAVFAPPPLPIHLNHYNLFRGFKIEKVPSPADFDPKLIVDHLGFMSEGNADFMLDLLAHRIQRPGERTGLGLVIVGPQGSGKSTVISLFAKAMMDDDYCLITEKAEQITGKFPQIGGKLLLVWEEAESGDTCSGASKLKHLITVESEYVEKKCENAIRMPLCFLPIVFANELDQRTVAIESTDRRYCVFRMNDKHYKHDPEYFARLYGAMEDQSYMRGFYDYLKSRDISQYRNGRDWAKARPITETYLNIQEAGRKPLDRWFQEIAESLHEGRGFCQDENYTTLEYAFCNEQPVSSSELRKAYACWSEKNGFKFAGNVQSFGTKLASLATGCEGSAKAWIKKATRSHNQRRFQFDKAMMIYAILGIEPACDVRVHCR